MQHKNADQNRGTLKNGEESVIFNRPEDEIFFEVPSGMFSVLLLSYQCANLTSIKCFCSLAHGHSVFAYMHSRLLLMRQVLPFNLKLLSLKYKAALYSLFSTLLLCMYSYISNHIFLLYVILCIMWFCIAVILYNLIVHYISVTLLLNRVTPKTAIYFKRG